MTYKINNKSFRWWWLILLKGILFLTVGVIFMVKPKMSYFLTSYAMILILAGALIFAGIGGSAFFASMRKFSRFWIWGFALGIITIFLGILLLLNSKIVQSSAIPIIVGIWLFFEGISLIGTAVEFKEYDIKLWIPAFLFAIIILFCSIMVFLRLDFAMYIFAYWIGISLILKGIVDIWVSVKYRKFRKKIKETVIDAEYVELENLEMV